MLERLLVVGLDDPELAELGRRLAGPAVCHALLPEIRIEDGRLLVERANGPGGGCRARAGRSIAGCAGAERAAWYADALDAVRFASRCGRSSPIAR